MRRVYRVVEFECFLEGVGNYPSYGVSAPSGATVKDLSPQKERVTSFVEQLNRLEASEIHFPELIDNFIVEPLLL